ncbi:MAG TPA: NAD-glutamate dehydrogenase [Geminicoccus sp.]|jgi:glutamate dehydrogenase|uniref:NAD-glutamate dehydrogenase n=1 Tax=Geminicoccus sp. TaxID=2024832 RepID=UPI002E31B73D|nr:NAD-glutamate dehydrogenase [Geminicoccus sp.]HEX2526524.1 NAD-glutamate dehydrogenase [Geminicoccus sp.]
MDERHALSEFEPLGMVDELVATRVPAGERDLVQSFVRRFFVDVADADIAAHEPADLYGLALSHLDLARDRRPGTARIRVFNPSIERHGFIASHTLIQIVNDDMPFLVDSVHIAVGRAQLAIHLTIHPVIPIRRGANGSLEAIDSSGSPESFILVEVDRRTDPAALERVEAEIMRGIGDVRRAVRDWKAMAAHAREAARELEQILPDDREPAAFLNWLADNHFTFLGYAAYDLVSRPQGPALVRQAESALGILELQEGHHTTDGETDQNARSASFAALPLEVRRGAFRPTPAVTVTKANTRATVHRPSYLDYVGVKRYAADGTVLGEHRFLGLFTSVAYSLPPQDIPLLRGKVQQVMDGMNLPPQGHAAKALVHILNTLPRDELFQVDSAQLQQVARSVLQLQDRQRLKLFLRQDQFSRFFSVLLYVPRERWTTAMRERIQRILLRRLNGTDCEFQAQLGDSPLALIFFIVRSVDPSSVSVNAQDLEAEITLATRPWSEALRTALVDAHGEEQGVRLFARFGNAFPVSYQERVSARAAVADIARIDALDVQASSLSVSLSRPLENPADRLRLKLLRAGERVPLASVLPIMENFGLRALAEDSHSVEDPDGRRFWLHTFEAEPVVDGQIDLDEVGPLFEEAFRRIFDGDVENDGFNRLILRASLDVEQVVILRAICRYQLQVGLPFSQPYVEQTLVANPDVARDLVDLFITRFDPQLTGDRAAAEEAAVQRIETGLGLVAVLDQDRILRRFLGTIRAMLRTNRFRRNRMALSFKLDSVRVPSMPQPAPWREIFVYGADVEAVHLRGGPISRGGIRWSDRREDFRTEILGLVKAQMVKNAVIVPVGAKGGFVVKRPPRSNDRQVVYDEGVRCYRIFLESLLDITDDIRTGQTIPPDDVVRHDGDDPYLVVAADKGTATFSDIANELATARGFWLGDAFASGGSAGYDHKKMGITAKGAWESVRRHFREMGIDPERDPITVIGIGDMSGDVFGNGMLLSRSIRLVAAFDHRHIFLDPDPDPENTFAERARLFDLPRSSWEDFDRALLSKGGGIFSRQLKSIPLSPEIRQVLAVEADSLPPFELMSAILKAPVDLFWNGGIGTYVKARSESHRDAQDRANDPIRVDGEDLRCKVVAEGGNLGVTQRGRIAFARKGGRIGTDFVDNSAGVDCSDHEVNIKILTGAVEQAGDLTRKQRDELLRSMTDEVAALVLRDNTLQNLALSTAEHRGIDQLDAQIGLIRSLESSGRLVRQLEFLPTDQELADRRREGRGLTRPELAVLLAYAKMDLFEALDTGTVVDDPMLAAERLRYFPRPLRKRFPEAIARHRLAREIVATRLANGMVNRAGITLARDLAGETGASFDEIARGYLIVRECFELTPVWGAVEDLPVSAGKPQIALLADLTSVTAACVRWTIVHDLATQPLLDTVERLQVGVRALHGQIDSLAPNEKQEALRARCRDLEALGLEAETAKRLAMLPLATVLLDALQTAHDTGVPAQRAAEVRLAMDETLDTARTAALIERISVRSFWDHETKAALRDDLAEMLRRATHDVLTRQEPLEAWQARRKSAIERYFTVLTRAEAESTIDPAVATVAVRSLGRLTTG